MADDLASALAALHQLTADFDASGPRLATAVDRITVASAHRIEGGAKRRVPVDTGATRSSIGVDIERHGEGRGYGIDATIGAQTSYAPFLEEGTERMAPRPFLVPSLEEEGPGYVLALGAAVGEFGVRR